MPDTSTPSVNSWLEDELYQQYQHDRRDVDPSWNSVFASAAHRPGEAPKTADRSGSGGAETGPAAPSSATVELTPQFKALSAPRTPTVAIGEGDQLLPLRGPALRIAENMTASLTVPVATSQRSMPVKVMEENRRAINEHRALRGEGKISFTHLIAWAIVRSVETVPALNEAYTDNGAESFRVHRGHLNLGVAVDVAGKDGARSLKVPSIKTQRSDELRGVRGGLRRHRRACAQ